MDILAPDILLGENQRVFSIRDNFINCVNYTGECTVWETVGWWTTFLTVKAQVCEDSSAAHVMTEYLKCTVWGASD